MECHIEQVLYRDQRTIKTRYSEVSKSYHQQTCLSCQNDHQKPHFEMENSRFRSYPLPNHHQVSSFSNFDGALNMHGGVSPSSLDNCHNQYFSKFKRLLNRTDSKCGCEDVNSSANSERRRKGVTPWVKKLQHVLLLSTYFSLLTFSNTHALPIMSDKPPFWVSLDYDPKGEPPNEMNTTVLNSSIISANSALTHAKFLKESFQNQTIASMGSDPEALYSTLNYPWLPKLPKNSSEEDFQQYLSSLEWQETLLDMYKHLQTISVPLEQLLIDITRDSYPYETLKSNFSEMEGLIVNVLWELHDSIAVNNLKIKNNVDRDIMPNKLREIGENKTDRIVRDWIILRELVNILEYTLAVCTYLGKQKH